LDDIDNMSGLEFENYLAHLMRERGFQVQVTPGTGDFGADLIANQGDDKYAIQAKRYAVHNKVPVHAVTEAVAAVPYYDCNQAMVITSGYFTSPAITYANKVRCQLVDRDTLAVWVKESERRRRKQNQEPRVYEPPAPIELHEVVSDEEIQSGLSSWTPGSEEGYVINTGRPPRPSNVLAHKAKCHTIRGLASRRFKISVADLKSIDAWGQNHMQENPRRCGICMRSGNRS
jgi:restriction system protein